MNGVIHFRDCSASNQVLHNDCLNPAPPSEISDPRETPATRCDRRRRGGPGATRSHGTFFNTMRVRPEPFLAENVVGRS